MKATLVYDPLAPVLMLCCVIVPVYQETSLDDVVDTTPADNKQQPGAWTSRAIVLEYSNVTLMGKFKKDIHDFNVDRMCFWRWNYHSVSEHKPTNLDP